MNRLEKDHKQAIKRRNRRVALRKVAKRRNKNSLMRTKHNGKAR